jgi:hypothetical protein
LGIRESSAEVVMLSHLFSHVFGPALNVPLIFGAKRFDHLLQRHWSVSHLHPCHRRLSAKIERHTRALLWVERLSLRFALLRNGWMTVEN